MGRTYESEELGNVIYYDGNAHHCSLLDPEHQPGAIVRGEVLMVHGLTYALNLIRRVVPSFWFVMNWATMTLRLFFDTEEERCAAALALE